MKALLYVYRLAFPRQFFLFFCVVVQNLFVFVPNIVGVSGIGFLLCIFGFIFV